jgi:hypothetical protein
VHRVLYGLLLRGVLYLSNESLTPHHFFSFSDHLGYRNVDIILVLDVFDAVLCDHLDVYTLEVDRHAALELLCAHSHDLEALLVVDIGMVVLVE